MPLESGAHLGPFEIRALLGAGAMGEVYRARDTRLGRDVAVKVLVPTLATDEAALERFKTEARAVAALSHPNIVAVYDIGRDDGTTYVVTELLEGQTLRERLASGPLPPRKAVDYTRQVAIGVAAAHQRGIVHRDLKPDNLFVTADGRVKVLDFGIAQMSAAPTAPDAETQAGDATGSVFGSVGYMAPEQVRGLAVDHRADIFAIGCVLYELLTGRGPFARGTSADTMAAVLNDDAPVLPESSAIDAGGGGRLDRIIRRCLEKSPDERFQSASDLAFALEAAPGDDARSPQTSTPRRLPIAIAAVASLVAVVSLAGLLTSGAATRDDVAAPAALVRFGIPATMTWSDTASVSPDGRYLMYTAGPMKTTANAPASGRFWVRPIDSLEPQLLSHTAEAASTNVFWSPDSRLLGYRSGNALVVREVPDGEPRVLAQLPEQPLAVAWNKAGVLLIATGDGLYRMPAEGGALQLVSRGEPGREVSRGAPSFLPDGERFLYTVRHNGGGEEALETRVGTLAGADLGRVGSGMVGAMYADGHVLFGMRGGLYAQAFDLSSLSLTGDPTLLGPAVAQDWRHMTVAARASDTGVLAFRAATRGDAQFTLVSRTGHTLRTIGAPDSYTNFSLSSDDQRLIASRRDPLSAQATMWLIDVERGVTSLVSGRDDQDADDPTWHPDGRHIAYRHGPRLVMRPANGGAERTLVDAEAYPDSFSRDGRYLVYGLPKEQVFMQYAVDITRPGAAPIPLVSGVTLSDEGRFSPDGKWIAYHSNETRSAQVYVIPFPPTGEKWQISPSGGVQPRWSADGNELFYLDPDGRLMAAALPGSDPRRAAAPTMLFSTGLVPSDAIDQFAPTKNGFVIRAPVSADADAGAVQVLVNWKPAAAKR